RRRRACSGRRTRSSSPSPPGRGGCSTRRTRTTSVSIVPGSSTQASRMRGRGGRSGRSCGGCCWSTTCWTPRAWPARSSSFSLRMPVRIFAPPYCRGGRAGRPSPFDPAAMTPQNLPHEPEVTLDLAREHGLTEDEYGWVVEELGRTPTFTELGIYSVMWSEHCSYKNSIAVLKTLPREGGALLVGAGEENAGLVDVGDGLAVAFKIESHNHPSAVEPYQGAATGVGGIQRDIFTMGARPICSLNSLRFGSLENPRVRYRLDGVVRGIGDYGNAFGVPTVAGEVYFDPSYEGNPLVNAMSVGVVKVGETASATAEGVGNP